MIRLRIEPIFQGLDRRAKPWLLLGGTSQACDICFISWVSTQCPKVNDLFHLDWRETDQDDQASIIDKLKKTLFKKIYIYILCVYIYIIYK